MESRINHFDNPKKYEKNSDLQFSFGIALIALGNLKSGYRVLDVGCGDGRLSQRMANEVGPKGVVIGIDISEPMVNHANLHYKQCNNLFIKMDVENMVFQRQFDVVFALNTIHWIKNLEKAFKRIKTALVENGHAIMLIPLRNEMDKIIDEMTFCEKWKSFFKDFVLERHFSDATVYERLLKKLEFSVNLFEEKFMTHVFENKTSMVNFLKACLPHVKRLTDAQCQEFLSDIVNEYCSRTEQVNRMDDRITFTIPELCIDARKIPYQLSKEKSVNWGNNPFSAFSMPVNNDESSKIENRMTQEDLTYRRSRL